MKLSKKAHEQIQKAILEALDDRELTANALVMALKRVTFVSGMKVDVHRLSHELIIMRNLGLVTSRKIKGHSFRRHLWSKRVKGGD